MITPAVSVYTNLSVLQVFPSTFGQAIVKGGGVIPGKVCEVGRCDIQSNGCDIKHALPRQWPGQNENGHLQLGFAWALAAGFCLFTWISLRHLCNGGFTQESKGAILKPFRCSFR